MKDDMLCKHCDYDIYLVGHITGKPYCTQCKMFLTTFEVTVIE